MWREEGRKEGRSASATDTCSLEGAKPRAQRKVAVARLRPPHPHAYTRTHTYLVNRVDGLHDSVLEELEVAELDRVVHAVVLEVLVVLRLGEVPAARHGVPVHVRDAAIAGGGVVSRGPVNSSNVSGVSTEQAGPTS